MGTRVTQELNSNGGRTEYGYDAAGRVISLTDPKGCQNTYSYDESGNQTKVTDPEGVYTVRRPEPSTGTADPLNNVTTCKYDQAGRLTGKIYEDNTMVKYTYGGNGNRLSMDDSWGEPSTGTTLTATCWK
ncbi:Rhs protein [Desulfocucumis palustris]|uniref:Rhs protein n=1 Tax=Desulfocucumis palustris TaxID=1898651 RepID=A0A2L2XDK8_9FIRM|nr:RHS repeat domain-containing protein [Desulfocucumis palustris]GBF32306.1 Rhs protein [Desulfocucumis palustris]